MSSDVVIRAQGLSKKYVIGHQAERETYVALRDVIARNARAFGRAAMDLVRGRPNIAGDELEEFWALRDVSFEVKRGEVVGVIGRNGAGKSTLLKVLSRITEPTEGRVEIRGRVASLLEVGTGFHPELTGRENIYLNGAVLGMAHAEIRRKFDEIVAFAEVERFLDTPVKRYSSGMYVRLAFAVAAHLEPEILIVDEVLAVGDAEFQKKCLGKMGEVAGQGRTVLFVSHNMAAMQALCGRSLLLSAGQLVLSGATNTVITRYLDPSNKVSTRNLRISDDLRLSEVTVSTAPVRAGRLMELRFEFHAAEPTRLLECCVIICAPDGRRVAIVDGRECGIAPCEIAAGASTLKVDLARPPMVAGKYAVGLHVRTPHHQIELSELVDLNLTGADASRGFIPVPPEWRGVIETSLLERRMSWERPDVALAPVKRAALS
jgi:lipopolysaccharide transport system ATP-binding protein